MEKYGEIVCNTGLIVTDPQYNELGKCNKVIDNAKKGLYHCIVNYKDEGFGERVSDIIVIHAGCYSMIKDWVMVGNPGENTSDLIGVDSAKVGIFDIEEFKNTNYDWDELGQVNGGCICSSGYGDGGYPLLKMEEDGEIYALRVNFL